MRRVQIPKPGQEIHRPTNEVLAEGINKGEKPRQYTEGENGLVIGGYGKRSGKMKDCKIAMEIGEEIGRSVGSVLGKIMRLRKEGKIGKNTENRESRDYSNEDIEMIVRRYKKFSGTMNDQQIAREISEDTGRNADSVRSKISQLRMEGKIGENAGKKEQRDYSEKEIDFIIQEFGKRAGKTKDRQIAREIAEKIGRSVNSISAKIRQLRKEGKIGENAEKFDKQDFSEEEIEIIVRRYGEGSATMKDYQIAKVIAEEMGRSASSVLGKISQLRKEGKIEKNQNKGNIRKPRSWKGMDDKELFRFALNSLRENGILTRYDLRDIDSGLYKELLIRKLLKKVFKQIERGRENEIREKGLQEIAEALEEFGTK